MLPFKLIAILPRINLPDCTVAEDITDAAEAACDPSMSLLNCPWNHHGRNQYFRARRIVWRFTFRRVRERGVVPLITTAERRVA